jgi:hypothetical protein
MAPHDVEVRYRYGGSDQIDYTEDDDFSPISIESRTSLLSPPEIIPGSFITTIRELADGSIVADVEFQITEVFGAESYEVRYT